MTPSQLVWVAAVLSLFPCGAALDAAPAPPVGAGQKTDRFGDPLPQAARARDGRTALSSGFDGTVLVWDLSR
jgi:hypothetical protein